MKDPLAQFLAEVGGFVGPRMSLVASGPDYNFNSLRLSDGHLYVNASLEHAPLVSPKPSVWFVGGPLLGSAGREDGPEIEERKKVIRGRSVDLVVASLNSDVDETRTRLRLLEVTAKKILILDRGLLRQMLWTYASARWIIPSLVSRHTIRRLRVDLDMIWRFFFLPRYAYHPRQIPMALKPSAGGQAALLLEMVNNVRQINITGIALGTNEYLRDGKITVTASRGAHHPTDELLLRTIVRRSNKTWSTTFRETSRRTGIPLNLVSSN